MLIRHCNSTKRRHTESGSATLIALSMLAVLAFIGANILLNVTRRANAMEKTGGWQEALYAAESGVDIAMANLRWSVKDGSPTAFDSTLGWVATTSSGLTTYTYTTPTMTGTGEGTVVIWAVVTVDPPTEGKDSYGKQWYRIRSTGHAQVAGLAQAAVDTLSDKNARHLNALRKFSLRKDRTTGNTVSTPEVTRTVEVYAQPKTTFLSAMLSGTKTHIHDTSTVDSFDSSDPTKSSTIGGIAGQYDVTKRQANGDVLTNGNATGSIAAGTGANNAMVIDDHTKVYGDVGTNGSNFIDAHNTIQAPGQYSNEVYSEIDPVPMPTWTNSGTGGTQKINNSVNKVDANKTITLDPDPANNYYKISQITKKLDLKLPAGVTSGTINIWVTDKMAGDGELHIPKGVTVKMYFSGQTFKPKDDDSKNGIDNDNQIASMFQLYGVSKIKGDQNFDLHIKDSNFYGTVYAPSGNLKLRNDAKATVGYVGSFVADNIDLDGDFHYDEALKGAGDTIDFTRVSYTEDDL